jgi:glycosyltransferase involved in cell wall biosynthesis
MPTNEDPVCVLMVMESVFPTAHGGGAESQVRTLGLEFLRRGMSVSVLVPMVRYGPASTVDEVDGIPVRRIPYPKLPLVGGMWMLIRLARILVRERTRYDVIHAHIAGNMSAVCSVVGHLLGKPVLVKFTGMTEMHGGVLDAAPSLGMRMRRAALRHASAYQATSERIARMMVERGFDAAKVRRIPNAVDVERFAHRQINAARRSRLCGDSSLVGIFIGRLEAEKGLDFLIDAWARVFEARREARLLLVGEGRERDALQARCVRLGLADQVIFVGPSRDVENYLSMADFGVLTSLHEGLSNTLLECMAAGLPVLGTRVSGTEDFVVDGRTGWLVEPGDVDSLAGGLAEVASCGIVEMRRRGREARALVDERASIRSIVDQLQGTYAAIELRPA